MKKGEIMVDKNGLMYYEDIICDICEKENCLSNNIKDWYRCTDVPGSGNYNGIIKYEVYEESDLNNNIKEIIANCNINNYKLNGINAIEFNNAYIYRSPYTGIYYLKINGKEKEYKRFNNVVKAIKKLI